MQKLLEEIKELKRLDGEREMRVGIRSKEKKISRAQYHSQRIDPLADKAFRTS